MYIFFFFLVICSCFHLQGGYDKSYYTHEIKSNRNKVKWIVYLYIYHVVIWIEKPNIDIVYLLDFEFIVSSCFYIFLGGGELQRGRVGFD